MAPAQTHLAPSYGPVAAPRTERIVVLDDSRAQRTLLCSLLRRWGHDVVPCDDPQAALDLLADPSITMVLCDWMMPGMTGPEFCRKARQLRRDSYAYIILLTSKSDVDAIAHGLQAGADDFLTKPVNGPELRARIHAGSRIIAMQREMAEKTRLVSAALSEISALYDALDRDLLEAKKLQASLLRETTRDFGAAQVAFVLQSSGHVGGDLVGYYPAGDGCVGLYSLDVSGHGVTSAMITARLAGMLSAASPEQNIAMARNDDGGFVPLAPHLVAARLNTLMLEEVETDHYFTLCLVLLEFETGRLRMVQAGHPHPLLWRADQSAQFLGAGGPPVGLLPDAVFETVEMTLTPGDRVLVYSDGVTECPDPDGVMLEEQGLIGLSEPFLDRPGPRFLSEMVSSLADFAQTDEFPDDVSALHLIYQGRS